MKEIISVRSVTHEDFPQWLALWEGYNEFYGRSGKTALSENVTKTTPKIQVSSSWSVHSSKFIFCLLCECFFKQ